MLPTSSRGNPGHRDSALGAAYGATTTYNVHSNDVLEGRLRVTVEESVTGRCIWFSERMLMEHEIVETVKENASQIIKWTIHRPKSGWYIRLRSPLFPPGSSVGLLPVEAPEAETGSGTLSFLCQTRIDLTPPPPAYSTPDAARRVSESSTGSEHSYPPPPPSPYTPSSQDGPPRFDRAPSAASVPSYSESTTVLIPTDLGQNTSGDTVDSNSSPPIPRTTADPQLRSEVTRFFARTVPRHSAANHLSFLPASLFGAPNKNFVIQTSSNTLPPVLMYHDTTPLLGSHNSGTIELDHGVARCLGVEPSWWIAVALAYIEFLQERDGYLAAAGG